MKAKNFFVDLDPDDLEQFRILRADGSTLARVPVSTNTIELRAALRTLWPGCRVIFSVAEWF